MKEKIKIAFAHDNITPRAQGIMAGIAEYTHKKGDWQLIIWPDNSRESLSFLKQRGCKGAFVSTQTARQAKELLQIGIPVIAISTLQKMLALPFISANSEQVAKLACEYFLKKKFRNFAFFGLTEARWSRERMEYFSAYLSRAGHEIHVFKKEQIPITKDFISFVKLWIDTTLTQRQQELVKWLKQLPKPIAILASCDILACHLSNAVKEADLSIPDEIAILGIDNDQTMCNICDPPLSSIALNYKKAGYSAAKLLERIISGQTSMRGQRIDIEPTHVETRGSTDIFAIDDPDVIQALKYIKKNSNKPLQVNEVASQVYISERSLQSKFQKMLGRSVHEEITHAHLEIAKAMLVETSLPIDEIASRSGFHYTSNMRRAFKQFTGLLPQKYRQQHRPH
jgi:LacI family transcriptional regulator